MDRMLMGHLGIVRDTCLVTTVEALVVHLHQLIVNVGVSIVVSSCFLSGRQRHIDLRMLRVSWGLLE
eukprot:12901700-Prorocentrum_lima.AAC.1